jgi:hypothetical protein
MVDTVLLEVAVVFRSERRERMAGVFRIKMFDGVSDLSLGRSSHRQSSFVITF